ncbi:hypothetical protein CNEO_1280048 [Clostridium neonatale]|nr:hypothetical protein CNEO_1280048 [Clostridium neonatale]
MPGICTYIIVYVIIIINFTQVVINIYSPLFKILQISYNKMYKYTKILIKNHKNYVEEINFSKNYENEI